MKYPFVEYTRVAVATSISDTSAPTVAELNAGTDVTCDLTKDGLMVTRRTSEFTRSGWASDFVEAIPDRFSTSVELEGYRFTPPDTELLWEAAATFRAAVFLVIRRGIAYSTAWAASQPVEVLTCRWGKRSVVPSSGRQNVTFRVPLLVAADDDDATVAA